MTIPLPSVESGERGPLLAPFMGWTNTERNIWQDATGYTVTRRGLPPWDRDNAAAHEVIERVSDEYGIGFEIERWPDGVWGVRPFPVKQEAYERPYFKNTVKRKRWQEGPVFAELVTAAALLALGVCVVPGREGA